MSVSDFLCICLFLDVFVWLLNVCYLLINVSLFIYVLSYLFKQLEMCSHFSID